MKNNILKFYVAAFYFCSIFVMVAQTPGTGNGATGEGALEDAGATDTTPMPIDDYLCVLVVIGLALVFMKFKAIQNKRVENN